jgi:hypothetical protein
MKRLTLMRDGKTKMLPATSVASSIDLSHFRPGWHKRTAGLAHWQSNQEQSTAVRTTAYEEHRTILIAL